MMSGFGWFRSGLQTSGPAPAPVSDKPLPGTCFHCGLPLPMPVADWVEFEGKPHPLCCASCLAAAEMLIANGVGDYYLDRNA